MRTPDLKPRGPLLATSGSVVLRNTGVATWKLSAQWDERSDRLQPGWGVQILDGNQPVLSGPATEFELAWQGQKRTLTASGISDMHLLQDMVVIPNPANPTDTKDAWVGSGPAETVICQLIGQQIGPAAPAAYRHGNLVIPATQGRGGKVNVSSRFKNLLEEVQAQAQAGKVLVDIRQDGLQLYVLVSVPRDLTRRVHLTRQSGAVGDYTLTQQAPTVNEVIVGGAGSGAARTLVRQASALDVWQRRIVKFEDKGSSGKSEEMQQAAKTALEEGVAKSSVTFDLNDTPARRFGRDFGIGDKVTIDLDGAQVTDTIQTAEITWDAKGRKIKLQVGPVPDESKLNQATGELVKTVQTLRTQISETARR
jgi:hypothetical protein